MPVTASTPDSDDEMVWVRAEMKRLAPSLGLVHHGDIALIPKHRAARFGRFATVVSGPDDTPLIDVWVDADPQG